MPPSQVARSSRRSRPLTRVGDRPPGIEEARVRSTQRAWRLSTAGVSRGAIEIALRGTDGAAARPAERTAGRCASPCRSPARSSSSCSAVHTASDARVRVGRVECRRPAAPAVRRDSPIAGSSRHSSSHVSYRWTVTSCRNALSRSSNSWTGRSQRAESSRPARRRLGSGSDCRRGRRCDADCRRASRSAAGGARRRDDAGSSAKSSAVRAKA